LEKSNWYKTIAEAVDEQRKNIPERDQNFFHVDRFLKTAEMTDKFASGCTECSDNKAIIHELSSKLSYFINTPGRERKNFGKTYDALLKHMRRAHGLYPARYFLSLYSFLGMFICGSLGFTILLMISENLKIPGLLFGFSVGVITGRILGNNKDMKVKAQSKRL